MINISTWSIRNPLAAAMLFVLLTFAGVISFSGMKIQNYPDIGLPTIILSTALPGASPVSMENDVARRIENAISTIQGLKHITTRIQDSNVIITIEFRLEKPVQEALDDVRSAIQRIRTELPADLREPIIQKLDLAAQPILAFTVSSSRMDNKTLSWFIDDEISRTLLSVKGVGAVNRVGGVNREIQVLIDPIKLKGLGITVADLSQQLFAAQSEKPGGRASIGALEQPIRTMGAVKNANELAEMQLFIQRPGTDQTQVIRLEQVATIKDSTSEKRSAAFFNGNPVVGFEVVRSRGESEVDVGKAVRRTLEELQKKHSHIQITEAFDFVTHVHEEYKSSLMLLLEGAILAVVVVWIFLRDWRATVISAIALPLSVIPAFAGMVWLGFTLNIVTLLALSLVIGILVDDAIVEVENIVRHLRMGKSPYQAALEASDEIGLAVIATTFTLIAVFLPTAFMSGIAGKFFKQFGWTASIAVFMSLVVARVLTPMLAAYFLKPQNQQIVKEPQWITYYVGVVRWCLRHRNVTLMFTALFFLGSIALIPLLPQGFLPADNNSQTQVVLELQPGSALNQTIQVSEQARKLIERFPEVRSIYTTIGAGNAGADPFSANEISEVRRATLTIQLVPRSQRESKQRIESRIRQELEKIPAVRTKVGLGSSGEKYVLVLTSNNPETLQIAATNVERELRNLYQLGGVTSHASLIRPEIVARIDFVKAADLGVTTSAIADTLRIAMSGNYDEDLPKINFSQRQVLILVRLNDSARNDLSTIERLMVPGSKGPVMLAQVAKIELSGGPTVIDRYDRTRNISFEIDLSDMPLGEVTKLVQSLPSIQNLPAGVSMIEVGDAEIMEELFSSFSLAMVTGVLCIYIILVLLFKDLLHPLTILVALPLSLGGSFVALLLASKSFSMPSLIGLIMLMGIATKNSILLVEYMIVAQRDRHITRFEAITDACRKRARAIIMTSVAMGAGMLPIALGLGEADPSFRSPMAISVIGGLITSTLLSLLVIPVAYDLMEELRQRLMVRFKKSKVPHPVSGLK
jgi:multidrug efflux pump subunit AcrB